MANTVDSKLARSEMLDAALIAFRKRVITLRNIFSTTFAAGIRENSNKVEVPFFPLHAAASTTRAAGETYSSKAAATATNAVEVTLDKSKLQSLLFTNEERVRNRFLDPVQLGIQAGNKLAIDILTDIFSVFTAANYPGTTLAATLAADFDYTSLTELGRKCHDDDWPDEGRAFICKPAYHEAVLNGAPSTLRVSPSDPQYREGMVDRAAGFDIFPFASLPANAQNLVGVACLPPAVLVGFAPLEPTEAIRSQLYDYEVMTDPETGIVLEFVHLAIGDSRTEVQAIESHYGYQVGDPAAAKRVFSA